MIYDKENLFFNNKAVSDFGTTEAYSDAVKISGAAYPNAPIDIRITGAEIGGGSLTIKAQTASDAAFTSPSYISTAKTFTTAMEIGELHDVIHITDDVQDYIRLEAQGSASITGDGKITAGIVIDHDQK